MDTPFRPTQLPLNHTRIAKVKFSKLLTKPVGSIWANFTEPTENSLICALSLLQTLMKKIQTTFFQWSFCEQGNYTKDESCQLGKHQ